MVDQALAFGYCLEQNSSMRHLFVLRKTPENFFNATHLSSDYNLSIYSVQMSPALKVLLSCPFQTPTSAAVYFPFDFMCFCGLGRTLPMVQLLLGYIWNKCYWIKESNIKESPKLKCRLFWNLLIPSKHKWIDKYK